MIYIKLPQNERDGTGFKELKQELDVVVHTFDPSTWEAEAGGSLSSRLAWSIAL